MTARISKQIFKKGFEIMSRNLSKSTKLGILDFGMTGPYHKIGNFLISVSTPTPKFMLDRVWYARDLEREHVFEVCITSVTSALLALTIENHNL